jgi:hypothetical protein
MNRKSHAVDAADAAHIAGADHFIVSTILGRGRYHKQRAEDLAAARSLRDAAGKDAHGRRPMIYAVDARGVSIFVE